MVVSRELSNYITLFTAGVIANAAWLFSVRRAIAWADEPLDGIGVSYIWFGFFLLLGGLAVWGLIASFFSRDVWRKPLRWVSAVQLGICAGAVAYVAVAERAGEQLW